MEEKPFVSFEFEIEHRTQIRNKEQRTRQSIKTKDGRSLLPEMKKHNQINLENIENIRVTVFALS